jgi:formamidopyrimidine-DNA glycosylase
MPELPEVETMRRGILGVMGSRIESAGRVRCRRRPISVSPSPAAFRRRVVGRTIDGVNRIGKRVVLRLSGEQSVVIEPRMTGLVLLADPPSREHLRFRFALSGGPADELLYWDRRGLGSIRNLSSEELDSAFGPDRLGVDALKVTAPALGAQLAESRREIKVALLDQRAIAGIGNLYAAEILHLAGIHPQTRCEQLRPRQWRSLHAAMRKVLLAAIRYEGSTLSDGTYRNALNKAGGYQNEHRVYAREHQECPSCKEAQIVRIVQAQLATFFCPRCQRASR